MDLYRDREIDLKRISDFFQDSEWSYYLVYQLPARPIYLLISYRDLYYISYVEIDLSAPFIYLRFLPVLCFLYIISRRLPGVIHTASKLLSFFSIQTFSSGSRSSRAILIKRGPRFITEFDIERA
jgi:hypothetical protein